MGSIAAIAIILIVAAVLGVLAFLAKINGKDKAYKIAKGSAMALLFIAIILSFTKEYETRKNISNHLTESVKNLTNKKEQIPENYETLKK